MSGKIGKALGFSMDHEDNASMASRGFNDSDIDRTVGGLPARAVKPAVDDSDSDEGEDAPDSGSMTVEPAKAAPAEVLAMRMFDRATTPEAKVEALKAFGEACGWTGGSY